MAVYYKSSDTDREVKQLQMGVLLLTFSLAGFVFTVLPWVVLQLAVIDKTRSYSPGKIRERNCFELS